MYRPLFLLGESKPSKPTRAEVCGIHVTFQGLTVNTKQFGKLPWFEPAIMCLDSPEDRQSVYQAKHAKGDTHCIIEFSSTENPVYHLGPYADIPIIIKNCETIQPEFRSRVEEIILNGFTPIVVFDGDDGDNYYGYPNALRQLPILVNLLKEYNDYILYARFWDGVFYGSSPEHIEDFGTEFRKLLPNGYLAIEHNTGHIPVGGGAGDYDPNDGKMRGYDVVCSEFDYGPGMPPSDNIWQVVLRMLGPAWVRPSDAPDYMTTDYAISRFYLSQGSPRGPYFYCAFEWEGAINWVQGITTEQQEEGYRNYLKECGCKYTG